jgi:probable phosphoglycerate mutase
MSTVRWVARPGETEFDGPSRIQGSLDLPLTDRGHQQVTELTETLRSETIDVIYASPTEPAASTANQLGETLGVPVKVIDGLANLHLGLWQGLLADDIRRKQPRVFKQWEDHPETICAPEGEECEEALERVTEALRKPLKRDEAFLIVAPEPIATLVVSVLRGEPAKLAGPITSHAASGLLERIGEPVAPAISTKTYIRAEITASEFRIAPAG